MKAWSVMFYDFDANGINTHLIAIVYAPNGVRLTGGCLNWT